ncbi:MAG: hypothetical protein IKM20_09270 [Erysipelotrichales bacterium]|nr:hypothetical protein [Erysipelotrichales bacterium]
MKELDKFLKNTKEITFMEFLDVYSDLEIEYTKEKAKYTFIFPEVDNYDEVTTTLKIDSKGHLVESTCNCGTEDDGYCVHELGAYIKYLELKNPKFDILEYLLDNDKRGKEDIWLEAMHFEAFDEEFEMSEEEMEEIMNFDIGEVFADMTKYEIIDFLRDLVDTYPVARFAILQHIADITLAGLDLDDNYDDNDMESLRSQLLPKTNKPS